jgi:hypothetical protein
MTDASAYYRKIRNATEFTVTEEHLKLLRRANVDWEDCEFGAPAIDCKRPYGNSDVVADIGEILGYEEEYWQDPVTGDYNETIADNFAQLHAETAIVLQIALATGEFRPGRYVCEKYTRNWHLGIS